MYKIDDFDRLDLTILNGKITSYIDTLTDIQLKSFPQKQ